MPDPLWLTGFLESLYLLIPQDLRSEYQLELVRGNRIIRHGRVDVEVWLGRLCVWVCPECLYCRTAPEAEWLYGNRENHEDRCSLGMGRQGMTQVRVRVRCRSAAGGLGALAGEIGKAGGEVPAGLSPLGTNRADEWWLPAWIPPGRLEVVRAWGRCREVREDISALTRVVLETRRGVG